MTENGIAKLYFIQMQKNGPNRIDKISSTIIMVCARYTVEKKVVNYCVLVVQVVK